MYFLECYEKVMQYVCVCSACVCVHVHCCRLDLTM